MTHPLHSRWQAVLDELRQARPEIEAMAVLSPEGLAHASWAPPSLDLDVDRLGAMSAAMLALADRTAQSLSRGGLKQAMVKGETGYVLITQAGPGAVLTVLCGPEAPLGMVFHDVQFAANAIAQAAASGRA